MSQIKVPAGEVRTRMEMEALAGEIADLKGRQRSCSAEMDEGLRAVRRHYGEILGGLDAQIAARMRMAREWAEANLAEFGPGKSLELAEAVIGFQTGPPKLKTLSGWTWSRVLRRLSSPAGNAHYVRTKSEVNKQRILLEREKLGAEQLRALGLRVAQDESFYVEPRLAEVAGREKLAA